MGNGNACTVVEASVAEVDEFGKEIKGVATDLLRHEEGLRADDNNLVYFLLSHHLNDGFIPACKMMARKDTSADDTFKVGTC